MNGERFKVPHGAKRERIDLMIDRYICEKYSFKDILTIPETKTVVSIPDVTLHSLPDSGDEVF